MSKLSGDLLSDFLENPQRWKDLFRAQYLIDSDRRETVMLAGRRPLSPVVLSELQRQNPGHPLLSKLSLPNISMVVTGQQLGLLGGPLMSLYKILSAVSLAELLERESANPVIPVFWLQSEDHDYAEISSIGLFSTGGEIVNQRLLFRPEQLGDSVGELIISKEQAKELLTSVSKHFSHSEEILALVAGSYRAGVTLGAAYADLMRGVLGSFGVLLFDPNNREIKTEFKSFVARNFSEVSQIGQVLVDRSRWIESLGYHPQVAIKDDSPLFFVSSSGKRERLTKLSNGVWQAHSFSFTDSELFAYLQANPERFTASALIRPIFQDTIFPTAAYVAGPSEFAYHAQLKPLYDFFNVTQPLIVPRNSFVVIRPREKRKLQGLQLSFSDLARENSQIVAQRYAGTEISAEALFGSLIDDFTKKMMDLKNPLDSIDPNLLKALDITLDSSLGNINRLKAKYERALLRKEEIVVSQLDKLRGVFYPDGQPQERMVAFLSYIANYGKSFLEKVYLKVRPLEGGPMQIIDLAE